MILPVALINPPVNKLPPIIFPVPERVPPEPEDIKLFAYALPVLDTNPPVNIFPPVILAALVIVEVALINPAVNIFAPTKLPVVETNPLEVIEVSVPTLVIFGCALVVTVPAVTALVTLPLTLAP